MSPQEFEELVIELETLVWDYCSIPTQKNTKEFSDLFKHVYSTGEHFNYYWPFCSMNLWSEKIEESKIDYLKDFPYSKEEDYYSELLETFKHKKNTYSDQYIQGEYESDKLFIKIQVTNHHNKGKETKDISLDLKEILEPNFYKKIFYQERAKREFLESKIILNDQLKNDNIEKLLPYGNDDNLNIKERYYILDKLGFIDSLVKSDILKKGKIRVLNLYLGCTENYAKELLNNKTRINTERKKELDKYIRTIKTDYF